MRRVLSLTAVLCGLVWLLAAGVSVGRVWYIQTVDSQGTVGGYTSLALDRNGYPHIGYHDYTSRAAKYTAWNGTSWTMHILVDPDSSCASNGTYTSLALDADGNPHITCKQG